MCCCLFVLIFEELEETPLRSHWAKTKVFVVSTNHCFHPLTTWQKRFFRVSGTRSLLLWCTPYFFVWSQSFFRLRLASGLESLVTISFPSRASRVQASVGANFVLRHFTEAAMLSEWKQLFSNIPYMVLQEYDLAHFNWKIEKNPLNMEGTFKSPRPLPTIVREATFSHRKPKRNNQDREVTEDDCLPPRAPVKSAPPISRVFKHTRGDSAGALQVSFRENGSSILLKLKCVLHFKWHASLLYLYSPANHKVLCCPLRNKPLNSGNSVI